MLEDRFPFPRPLTEGFGVHPRFVVHPLKRYPTPRTVSINSLPPFIFFRSMCTC